MRLLPIVEGHGDLAAIPLLLRRLLHESHQRFDVEILRPYQYGGIQKVAKNFQRFLLTAAKENASILWTCDCDDGCPVEWVARFQGQLPSGFEIPIRFAFLVREYECIFLAERTCLAELGIPAEAGIPTNAESIRAAKETISRLMPTGTAYKETVHQARLTARIDLDVARQQSRSLRHIESALLQLIGDPPE